MKYIAAALLWATQLMLLAAGAHFLFPSSDEDFDSQKVENIQYRTVSSLVHASQACLKDENNLIEVTGARLEIPAGALSEDKVVSLSGLLANELPELDPGLVNVTKGGGGYRCLPHGTKFLKDVRFSMAFDTALIPAGYNSSHIRTFFYDETAQQWISLPYDTLLANKGVITSLTTHFTDFINGIIKTPDAPETQAILHNSIKDYKPSEPSAGIVPVAPPEANNQGSANIQLPLKIPSGRKGMEPALLLRYNNEGGNSWMGLGWDISVPGISIETRWGVPRYHPTKESETYNLSGEMLTPVAHRSQFSARSGNSKRFYPRVEGSFRKIIRHGNSPKNYWWEVVEKNGTRSFYGGDGSQVDNNAVLRDDAGNIAFWALRETRDLNTNFIHYRYATLTAPHQGKQFYPESIRYTGHSNEEGRFSIQFIRESGRKDAYDNCRLGLKQVTADVLKRIDIAYQGQIVRSYNFTYREGAFYKTLLASVVETDQNGEEFVRHDFDYYDEVRQSGVYKPFGPEGKWTAPASNISSDMVTNLPDFENRPSMVGSAKSESSNGGMAVVVGSVNGSYVDKSNTIGGAFGFNGASSDGLTAFVDIDGDGKPDNVFREDGKLKYCKNLSTRNGNWKFSDIPVTITGVSHFSRSKTSGSYKGVEANLFIYFVGYTWSKSKTITDTYFTDFNGDRLVDIAHNGRVYFNHINSNGHPTFSLDSDDTPNPIIAGEDINKALVEVTPGALDTLIDENPLHDVVRFWEAPLEGWVHIDAPVMLLQDTSAEAVAYGQKDGVIVAIQRSDDVLWSADISPSMAGMTLAPALADSFKVKKGDRFYFRVQSVFDGAYDRVAWDPLITYLHLPQPTLDPNGKSYARYRASEDFLLSAPQHVGMPLKGKVSVDGFFKKMKTSDDLLVEIIKTSATGAHTTLYTQIFGWNDTLEMPVVASFDVDSLDEVTFRVNSATNIEWANAIAWKPHIYYTKFDNGMPATNSANKPTLEFLPAIDYTMFNDMQARPDVWVAGDSGTIRVSTFSLPTYGHPLLNGKVTLSAKGVYKLYGKKTFEIVHGRIEGLNSASFLAQVKPGDVVYLEYHLENDTLLDSLYAIMPLIKPNLIATIALNGQDEEVVNAGVFTPKFNIWLGPQYRNWGFFAYNGNRERAYEPIPENLVNQAPAQDPGSIPDKISDIDPKYDPAKTKLVMLYPDIAATVWRGFDEQTWVSPTGISSSRLGEDNLVIDNSPASGSGAAAPRKITRFSAHNFTLGQSVLFINQTMTHSDGNTEVLYSVMDLNGDGYPDIISTNKVQFTTPLGGLDAKIVAHGLPNQNGSSSNTGATIGGGGSYNFAKKNSEQGPRSNNNAAAQGANSTGKAAEAPQTASASIGLSLSTASGFEESADAWIDINGDGLPDKVFKNGDVALNLGYRFASRVNHGFNGILSSQSEDFAAGISLGFNYKMGSITAGLGLSKTEAESLITWQDVNSDGLADQLIKMPLNGLVFVRLNQGERLSDWIEWEGVASLDASKSIGETAGGSFTVCIPIPFIFIRICFNPSVSFGHGISRQTSQLTDVDGDGYVDVVRSDKGDELFVKPSTIGRTNLLRSVKRPMNGSFNLYYAQTENSYQMPTARWVLDSIEIFDGLEGDGPSRMASSFEYTGGNYNRREREFYGFSSVVSRQLNTADNDRPYRVQTRRFANEHYYEKGLLLWETVVDEAGKRYSETVNTYEMRNITTGQQVNNPGNDDAGSVFPALVKTEKMFYEGQPSAALSTATTWEYDLSGNIVDYVETGDGSPEDLVRAAITYHNLPIVGLSNLPQSIRVQAGSVADIRFRKAEIDSRGNVVKIQQFLDDHISADVDMEYDEYGNLIKISRPANYLGKRMWYAFSYDNEVHAYITEIRDAHQLTSQSLYDYVYGQLLESTDMNGKKIKYTLDEKGRISTITGPYEIASGKPYTIAFDYHPEAPVPYASTRHYDPENGGDIETYTFMDGLMRPVQVKKTGAVFVGDGQPDQVVMIVSGASEYDAFGRTIKQYFPITEPLGQETTLNNTVSSVAPTVTRYDVLDRPISVTLPDGSKQQTQFGFAQDNTGYTAFLSKMTDHNGNIQELYTDLRNRKRATRVFGSQGDIWTGFRTNAIGELMLVVSQENDSTVYRYDKLGRNTEVKHPDFGLNKMTYDLSGNVLTKSTPDLRKRIADTAVIHYTYDYNRLVQVDYPENYQNQIKYTYGAAGAPHNRAGRMWLQQDASGGQEFFFGPLGEVEKTIRTIVVNSANQHTFVWEAQYDTWNRIQQLIYPDGEKVDYGYNRAGKVSSVSGEKGGNNYAYMVQMGYDVFEQRVFARMGNGTVTDYSYDEKRRWLSAMNVMLPDGRRIVSNRYDYDLAGNILSLTNSATPVNSFSDFGGPASYTFEYDPLYQLTNATGNWAGGNNTASFSLDMEYDNRHNILRKNQQHYKNNLLSSATTYDQSYSYEGNRPHAPSAIGKMQFTYDENGNNTGWTGEGIWLRMIWNEDNQLAEVSDNGFISLYTYDASGERVLKSSGGVQQIAMNGLPTGLIQHRKNYTAYVSPYLVARDSGYTKHYFIEGQRIATKLGEGYFANKLNFTHGITAGGLDYVRRAQLLKAAADSRLNTDPQPPGVPNAQGQHHVPSASHLVYAPVFLSDSAYSNPPESWKSGIAIGAPTTVPGVPVWKPPFETNDGVNAGYGYHTPSAGILENSRYFYHPDHLGSSSYITDRNGRVTQHLEYMPFGETFVEEYRATDPQMPYRYSGKEQDAETGFCYFGARYYHPRFALWLSVDPMTEKYPGWSGYNYVLQNPMKLVDPDGKEPLTAIVEGLIAFGVSAGADFVKNTLVEGQSVPNAIQNVDWAGAVGEGVKTTLIAAVLPPGAKTLKTAVEFSDNLISGMADNFANGDYNDDNGNFDLSKLGNRLLGDVAEAGVNTLVSTKLGKYTDKMENAKLIFDKKQSNYYSTLARKGLSISLNNKNKELNMATINLFKATGKAALAEAGSKTIEEGLGKALEKARE